MGSLQALASSEPPARPPTPIHAALDVEAALGRARSSSLDQKKVEEKAGDRKKARGGIGYGDEKKVRVGYGDEKKVRVGYGDEKKVRGSVGDGDLKKAMGSVGHDDKKSARGTVGYGDEKKASEQKKALEEKEAKGEDMGNVDYVHRGQWVRAAILGANDGLVSTASLMLGVGALKDDDAKAMVVSGLAGLVGGACSMAIGEFVSVYSQRDAEKYDKKWKEEEREKEGEGEGEGESAREKKPSKEVGDNGDNDMDASMAQQQTTKEGDKKGGRGGGEEAGSSIGPNPWEAAGASGLSFALGAMVPLLSAGFIQHETARLGVMIGVCSAALICMGAIGAKLSAGSVTKGGARVLLGGWAAMLVTFGLLRLLGGSVRM